MKIPDDDRNKICTKHLLYGGELLKLWLKQVYYQGPCGKVDELFLVMQRAYSEDPKSKFIHLSPDTAVVVLAEPED